MDRRSVLVAAGSMTALAGCPGTITDSGNDDLSSADREPPTNEEPTPANGRATATRPSPGTSVSTPFRFGVEVRQRRPTAETPPVVRVTVTNVADECHGLTTPNYSFPFTADYATADGASLVLRADIPEERDASCWAGTPISRPATYTHAFDPGESVSGRYAVVNGARDYGDTPTACWPANTFAFVERYALDAETFDAADERTFRWGFRVRVDDRPAVHVTPTGPFVE